MIDLRKVLKASADQLKIELEVLRAALKHPTQKGTVAEGAFKRLLREILPKRLGVTEGIIISSDNFVSSQIDIIIYDEAECPVIFSRGATKVIPIEFVYAVFEVKTSLTQSGFSTFLDVQRNLKSQTKYLTSGPIQAFTYHAYGSTWNAPQILSGILALECNDTGAMWQAYKKQYVTYAKNLCVDIVLAGLDDVFCHWNDQDGPSLQLSNPDRLGHVNEDATFLSCILISILSTQWKMLQSVEMYRYAPGKFNYKYLEAVSLMGSSHPKSLKAP